MRVSFESTVRRIARSGAASVLFVAGAAVAVMLAGSCQAPLEQKKGYLGDFCNGSDKECRAGLVCQEGVCTSVNDAPDACDTVCAKFSACGFSVNSCDASCLKTLRDWSKTKTETYANCYQRTDCSEIDNEKKPWNHCFQQLELPEGRKETCNRLESKSTSCLDNADAEDPKKVSNMKGVCRTKARTVASETWSAIGICAEQNSCGKLFQCVNNELDLSKKNKFPTSKPN